MVFDLFLFYVCFDCENILHHFYKKSSPVKTSLENINIENFNDI